MSYNVTSKIQQHYDFASPYYEQLWGNHIHHGYWITGKESKEEAAENLIQLLIQKSSLKKGSKVLDVGCGIGGTSIYLATKYRCDVTGITISPVQVAMATASAAALKVKNPPRFMVDDANHISVKGTFDIVWSVEMISHLNNRDNLFRRASELLRPGGKMCITDWLKDDGLSKEEVQKYIDPIEKGMLVQLPSFSEYESHIQNHGFRLLYYEDISSAVSRTWDITSESIKPKVIWGLASKHSKELTGFLQSFKAMRAGFKSGAFRYPAMVLEKR
ncbi:MAG: class I SAM-dependent methyltransferase [Taibaiella sp.]|nr:class I SAM-dependent methyltransferase [Taibaiella sp.]